MRGWAIGGWEFELLDTDSGSDFVPAFLAGCEPSTVAGVPQQVMSPVGPDRHDPILHELGQQEKPRANAREPLHRCLYGRCLTDFS